MVNNIVSDINFSDVPERAVFGGREVRVSQNNIRHHPSKVELSHNIDIHLMTDKKQILTTVKNDNQFVCIIPSGVKSVHILSKNSSPSDKESHLGVLIGDVTLFDNQQINMVDTHLTDHTLAGWHQIESSLYRWTNGNALLPLTHSDKVRILSITVIASGSYVQFEPHNLQKAS